MNHPGSPKTVFAFEQIGAEFNTMPLAARRALDECGARLSADGWRMLPRTVRERIVALGAADQVQHDQVSALVASVISSTRSSLPPSPPPDPRNPPAELLKMLGDDRPIGAASWTALRSLERYALCKLMLRGEPEKLARAYDEIVGSRAVSTHLTATGDAMMVDVGEKAITHRRAVASCSVRMRAETLQRLTAGQVPKGDVMGTARVAGIMAAKRTSELIPLCHPIATTRITVELVPVQDPPAIHISCQAEALDRTGVEMEAMVGASMAALTLYDMLKGLERGMVIEAVRLEMKDGGRSGRWIRETTRP